MGACCLNQHMLATVHLVVGAAIGQYVDSWPLALGAAFVSHFFLDALPHADAGTLKEPEERGSMNMTDLLLVFLDLVVALGLLFWVARKGILSETIFAGAFGGIAPDFGHGLYHILPGLKTVAPFSWYYRFHRRIQGTVNREEWVRGAVVELLVVIVALVLLLR